MDAHGTDRYLLTFTVPVRAGVEFLGVVGADVPVSRFEAHLLRAWAPDRPVVLVNAENRVVVSHSARIPVGDLLPPGISTRSAAARPAWRAMAPGAPLTAHGPPSAGVVDHGTRAWRSRRPGRSRRP